LIVMAVVVWRDKTETVPTSTPVSATSPSGTPAPNQCQGLGRGPLGLVDWGQICLAVTDPGKAFASALGIN
jgi:hypothetical protein